MFKLTILLAIAAYAHAGVIAPVFPVAHPIVSHPVAVAHPVAAVSHTSSVVHHAPARLVHAPVVHATPLVHGPVVHAAPLVHTPVVPVVRHAPVYAVHHG